MAAFTFAATTLFLLPSFPHIEGRSQPPPSPLPPKIQYLLVNIPDGKYSMQNDSFGVTILNHLDAMTTLMDKPQPAASYNK